MRSDSCYGEVRGRQIRPRNMADEDRRTVVIRKISTLDCLHVVQKSLMLVEERS